MEEPIVNFLESNDYDKPLMVVVRCKYGSSNSTVDACRKWLEENYHAYHFDGSMGGLVDEYQLLGKLYIPHGADEQQVKVLLYNRLLEQLEPKYLKYSVALCRTLQKPTICLVNDYCNDRYDEKDLDLSNYRVMYYDGDMSISDWEDWLDWNSKQTEELRVSPEIFAFVNYELISLVSTKK